MKKTNYQAMIILGIQFFVFGFITWLNGALIPFLKLICEIESDVQAFLVTFSFYMAYFLLAIPSAWVLKMTGYKKGMSYGLLIIACGSLIFVPAAQMRSFELFLFGLFIQSAGITLLQTASNPYVSVIGPIESAAKRISIMGICNKLGGTISPVIFGLLVLSNLKKIEGEMVNAKSSLVRNDLLAELSGQIIDPYIGMAVILSLLAIYLFRSNLKEIETEENISQQKGWFSIIKYPHLLLGTVAIFFALGAEVMAGDAIGIYGNSSGMTLDQTKYFTTYTLLFMLFGYSLGIIAIPKYISQQNALAISSVLGCIFSLCIFLTNGYVAIFFISLLGFANALMWPTIFPLAIKGLGSLTKQGAALLIMGISGGALVPLLYAMLKEHEILPNEGSFLVTVLPCYLYIFYYAVHGYKLKARTSET